MVVSTENINHAYEIKGIVSYYLSGTFYPEGLSKDSTFPQRIDFVIKKMLAPAAEKLEADAIIGLNISPFPHAGALAPSTSILFYGTAIKLL